MSKRILVADDTAYMRALIRETLMSVGLNVVAEADNGSTAINMYRQHQPDLIILNIVMPDMNGIEALKQIKAWDPHAKVIVCSALGQASTVFSAVKSGATEFVIKPFDAKRLIDAICRALSLKFIQPIE
jgi:two-component system, chemotaxis family, chemotaxis protein CheY